VERTGTAQRDFRVLDHEASLAAWGSNPSLVCPINPSPSLPDYTSALVAAAAFTTSNFRG